jgi:hypothetical protein
LAFFREEGIPWSAGKCTVTQLARLKPPLKSFILLLRGIPEYTASQQAGANLADKKPVSSESYLIAEFQPYEQICYLLLKSLVQTGKITIFQQKVNKHTKVDKVNLKSNSDIA